MKRKRVQDRLADDAVFPEPVDVSIGMSGHVTRVPGLTPGKIPDEPCERCGSMIMKVLMSAHLAGHRALDEAAEDAMSEDD